jgi:hypothetical protein
MRVRDTRLCGNKFGWGQTVPPLVAVFEKAAALPPAMCSYQLDAAGGLF